MMPSPPALETADASWARAMKPIGACTIGYSIPRSSVILVRTAWHAIHMRPRPPTPRAPVIIEVALNGVTSRRRNPNVPATVEEHTKDALACIDAGATIIHTHAPELVVGADEAAEQYATAFRPVVEQHPGHHLLSDRRLRPDDRGPLPPRRAARRHGPRAPGRVDTGSVNLGGTGRRRPAAHERVRVHATRSPRSSTRWTCARRAGSARASRSSSPASCRSCSRTRDEARSPPARS